MTRRSDVKERMVSAGEELFAQRGYGATMLDVIELANAPRGSIYYYFPNGKEELALEVARKVEREIVAFVKRVSEKYPDPAQFLQRLVEHNRKRLVTSSYDRGCPMMGIIAGGENRSPDLQGAVAEVFTNWTAAITDALRTKGFSAADSGRLARMTVTGIEGAIVVARATNTPTPFVELGRWIPIMVDASSRH